MKPRHQVSRAAVTLIKRFEGFRARAAELDDGRWTIGYGHTKTARAGAEVGEADAEALLLYDLINVAHAVNEWSYAPLNQNQFDALVSFAFNIGLENFRRSTTLRRVNEGRMLEAALAMELWRRADFEGERIVVDALVRRRAYEKILFLTPTEAWAPAPSPVLPPKIDYDVAPFTLTSPPTILKTELSGERAIAERQAPPPAPLIPLEENAPTASELAAAAVRKRLEALIPSEAPPLPLINEAPASTPAPGFDAEKPVPANLPSSIPFPELRDEAAPRDIDVVPSAEPHGLAAAAAADAEPTEAAIVSPAEALTLDTEPKPQRRKLRAWVWGAAMAAGIAMLYLTFRYGFQPTSPTLPGVSSELFYVVVGLLGLTLTLGPLAILLLRLAGDEEG